MGTRSIVTFKDESNNKICDIYQQYDGYPDGVGKELVEFLKSGKLVNGIDIGDDIRQFNGMGCLAAQFIEQFKDGAGGLYVHTPSRDYKNKRNYYKLYWAEYYYEVDSNLTVTCWDTYNNKIEEISYE